MLVALLSFVLLPIKEKSFWTLMALSGTIIIPFIVKNNEKKSTNNDNSYGGMNAKEFDKYKGEAVYAPEEDTHFPTLTLKETLTFALRCKTPGVRLPEETRRQFRQKVMEAILKMFGLVNQAHTVCFSFFSL